MNGESLAALKLLKSDEDTFYQIFGDVSIKKVWDLLTPENILEKFKAYEDMPVHVGDIVQTDYSCNLILITSITGTNSISLNGISSDGTFFILMEVSKVRPTGRSIKKEYLNLLKEIGKEADNE